MLTYCFLASNQIGAIVGGTIGSILLLIIVTLICCVTVAVSRKYRKRQNVNTQQVELQTTRSPGTTQTTTRTDPSRPFPNTTFNTLLQTQNQYSSYVTEHNQGGDIRPPLSYNPTEPHGTPSTILFPYPPLYSQESSAPYPSQTQTSAPPYESPGVQASRQQASSIDNCEIPFDVQAGDNSAYELTGSTHVGADADNVEAPCMDVKTLRVPPPPSYIELFKN